MARALWWILCACFAVVGSAAPDLPPLADDTTCSIPEESWFDASANFQEILSYASAWSGSRSLHVLDCFGYSGKIARQWTKEGFVSSQYDIKLNHEHDVVSRAGYFALLDLALSLVCWGVLIAGPPCSLFVGASSSLHRRRDWRPLGDTSWLRVRLANLIWHNFGTVIKALMMTNRNVFFILEQPAQSFAFKLPMFQDLTEQLQMFVVLTYLAYFGTDLAKPTHLLGNLRTLEDLRRTLVKRDRIRFAARLVKRNAKRKHPREYYKKLPDGKWQGGKDLASSAAYTAAFARALFTCWKSEFNARSAELV